ncbi:Prostate stem cell antigen, partial [Ophiophagus hannah]
MKHLEENHQPQRAPRSQPFNPELQIFSPIGREKLRAAMVNAHPPEGLALCLTPKGGMGSLGSFWASSTTMSIFSPGLMGLLHIISKQCASSCTTYHKDIAILKRNISCCSTNLCNVGDISASPSNRAHMAMVAFTSLVCVVLSRIL